MIETADMGRDCLSKLAALTDYEHFTMIIHALMMIEKILHLIVCETFSHQFYLGNMVVDGVASATVFD